MDRPTARPLVFWAAVFVVLEAGLRLVEPSPAAPSATPPTAPDPDLGYVLAPHLDRSGGYGPETAALRILCVGNSNVWGHFLGEEGTFPRILADSLVARGRPARVVNAGVPGYTAGRIRRNLERRLAAETFTLVVFTAGWNDLHAAAAPAWARGLAAPGSPPGPLGRVALLRLADRALERLAPLLLPADRWDAARLDETAGEVRRIVRAARSAGARVYALDLPTGLADDSGRAEAESVERVVYPPVRPFTPAGYRGLFRETVRRYREAVEAENAPLVRAGIEFETPWDEKRLLLLDQCHPSPGGNRRIADAVVERMEADGLLN